METKEIEQTVSNKEIDEVLNKSELPHIPITYYGHNGFFVPIDNVENQQLISGIRITMCNKDCCMIHPHEILYITIEDRKTVFYLTDRKIETNYRLDHWKKLLDEKYFAQPHSSYIVNLSYVDEVTKEYVKVKYAGKTYFVYTSSRRIGTFKKAFLLFKG